MNRKPIFDAVEGFVPGIWNRPGAVAAMDNLLDMAGAVGAAATDPFITAVTKHLRFEEGAKARAYKDHLGYWTIGIGRLIDPRKGGRISDAERAALVANVPARANLPVTSWVLSDVEMDMLLANDIDDVVSSLSSQIGLKPAWGAVQGDIPRMVGLVSMRFQLGEKGLAGFKNTLAMIAAKNFAGAADNMLLSLWAKQTPARARRVAAMMRGGK